MSNPRFHPGGGLQCCKAYRQQVQRGEGSGHQASGGNRIRVLVRQARPRLLNILKQSYIKYYCEFS